MHPQVSELPKEVREVLKPRDLARLFGLSVRIVYRELNKGTIPARKVGGSWLISSAAIRDWLARKEPAA